VAPARKLGLKFNMPLDESSAYIVDI